MASGIREFGRSTPQRMAVRDGDRELTFGGLDERSNRLAQGLLIHGIDVGDRVAVLSDNRLEYFEIGAALAKAGIAMVPLNSRNSAADNQFILEHSGVRGLILDPGLADRCAGSLDAIPLVLDFDGTVGRHYESFLAEGRPADPDVEVRELDTFCISYTSGTTGRPKGVELTHRGRFLTGFGAALDWGLGPGRHTLAVAPMYHGAGFAFAYSAPMFGGSVSVLRSWDPEKFLAMAAADRAESVFRVPTHAQHIRRVTATPTTTYDLSALHTLYFNASALPVALKEWVLEAFPGVGVHELYGSTECSVVTNLRPEFARSRAGSVGHPWFLNEVKLLDTERREVGPGVPGELYARSPLLLKGYLNDTKATEESFTTDGFFTVGDVAVRDEDGFISIVDRTRDMIIVGGVNIYPREIEELIMRDPQIEEVAVVGVPDETYGERVVAFVVPRDRKEIRVEELQQRLEGTLARYKQPREWHISGCLPRNASGKVLKRQLQADYTGPAMSSDAGW
jgi:long-chain acyl-CoA synthetase